MKILKSFAVFIVATVLFISGCSDNNVINPPNPNEEELITTVILNFLNLTTGQTLTFEFDDPDGEGGNPPVRFDSIRLASNSTYDLEILLLDRSKTPVDTVSEEIEEEADEHQFFFTPVNADVSIVYLDFDKNNVPLGLKSRWTTGNISNGAVNIVLKHQPGIKPTSGAGDPNIGETDVEVEFVTFIE